jgi:hypothetical protein
MMNGWKICFLISLKSLKNKEIMAKTKFVYKLKSCKLLNFLFFYPVHGIVWNLCGFYGWNGCGYLK